MTHKQCSGRLPLYNAMLYRVHAKCTPIQAAAHKATHRCLLRPAASQLDEAAKVASDARAAWAEANQKQNGLSTERAGLETKLGRDYGPGDVFLPLVGRCVSAQVEKYEYEVCPFGAAAQKDGGSSTRRAVLLKVGCRAHPQRYICESMKLRGVSAHVSPSPLAEPCRA